MSAELLSPEIREAIRVEVARAVAQHRREEYVTVKEAASIARCNPQTILRLAHAGKLREVGEGRLLRILRSSIDAYFAA